MFIHGYSQLKKLKNVRSALRSLTYIEVMAKQSAVPLTSYSNPAGFSLIQGGHTLIWSEYITPQRAGSTRLIATLDCAAMRQVQGQANVTIEP